MIMVFSSAFSIKARQRILFDGGSGARLARREEEDSGEEEEQVFHS